MITVNHGLFADAVELNLKDEVVAAHSACIASIEPAIPLDGTADDAMGLRLLRMYMVANVTSAITTRRVARLYIYVGLSVAVNLGQLAWALLA